MISGIGVSLGALATQQRRMDALADDAANVNTAGYRARGGASRPESDAQGALVETGQPLDLAIEGDGWFAVTSGAAQPALTRAGVFEVDGNGQIVTRSGERLVPPVQLPPGADASSVVIAPDGAVTVGGSKVGQIQLTGGSGKIRQGALESSNVDIADTTVGEIETSTSYAAALQALHVQDDMWASLLDLRA